MPHIDFLGRFTGESVYTLACDPADVLSTTVATVFSRLKRYAYAHNDRNIVLKLLRTILSAAAYYVLTKNSYFMDRLLFFLRNLKDNGRQVHRLTLKFLARCDADKRFVYGQVCYQTNWLIFRACKPRDKSHHKTLRLPTNLGRDLDWLGVKNIRSHVTMSAEDVAIVGPLRRVLTT
jgi:hypothetical protein